MPNPRTELVLVGEKALVEGAAKIGLLDVAGVGGKSLLEPEVSTVINKAIGATGNDAAAAILSAAQKSGTPLVVDVAKIRNVSEALGNGSKAQLDGALTEVFRPRTYAEMHSFYGG